MAGGIELANARNFLDWTLEQPWMVLHELAHAYHHKFLPGGFENSELKAAYQNALKSKGYDSVLKIAHTEEKAYATTNPMEYFAETTEAFFGTNDFFPFVRSELRRHDPVGLRAAQKAVGRKVRPGSHRPGVPAVIRPPHADAIGRANYRRSMFYSSLSVRQAFQLDTIPADAAH